MSESAAATPGLNIGWLAPFTRTEVPYGSTLRYVHFAKSLAALGHRLHFLASDPAFNKPLLAELAAAGHVASFAGVDACQANACSRLLIHPGLRNRITRAARRPQLRALSAFVAARRIDVLIVSDQAYLPLVPELRRAGTPVFIDWADSETLARWRQLRQELRQGNARAVLAGLRALLPPLVNEAYYPGVADGNILVSPVDKLVLDRLSRVPARNHLVPNGVDFPPQRAEKKLSGRLIFSGHMYFRPNFEAALWFADRVFPLVRRERPEVEFIVAGCDPIPELAARAGNGVVVTGTVPDLLAEISRSQIYVAPLLSGSGFKNKVVEAMAAGTYVVGTSLAAEFLPEELRRLMTVADTPENLARALLDCLDHPARLAAAVAGAQAILRRDYSWERQARLLVSLFQLS